MESKEYAAKLFIGEEYEGKIWYHKVEVEKSHKKWWRWSFYRDGQLFAVLFDDGIMQIIPARWDD